MTTRSCLIGAAAFLVGFVTAAFFLFFPPPTASFLAVPTSAPGCLLAAGAFTFAVAAVIDHDG